MACSAIWGRMRDGQEAERDEKEENDPKPYWAFVGRNEYPG